MAVTVTMPKLGLTMVEGTVVAWLKRVGEAVQAGEAVCEITTDKINNAVEASASGLLLQILVPEGATVACHTPIAVIGNEGEAAISPTATQSTAVSDGPATGGAATAAGAAAAVAAPVAPTGEGRVRISPVARKMATAAGLDPRTLVGSGPSGRIVMADVERALQSRSEAPAAAAPVVGPRVGVGTVSSFADTAAEDRVIAFTPMRSIIAERMTASLRDTAQLTLMTTVDAGALVELRLLLVSHSEQALGFRLSFNDFIVRAVAVALREHPEVNASWGSGGIHRHGSINVGVAVDVQGGLLVPVLLNADQLSLGALHQRMADMAERARTGKVSQADLTGGTITVSNLGMHGVEGFTPVLNPPESAILGVGAIRAVPVVRDGAVVPGHELVLSLTIDHRVIDGAPGARFLASVRRLLEQPGRLAL